jgi:hypothetical protein
MLQEGLQTVLDMGTTLSFYKMTQLSQCIHTSNGQETLFWHSLTFLHINIHTTCILICFKIKMLYVTFVKSNPLVYYTDNLDTMLWYEQPRNCGLLLRSNKRLPSSLKYPGWQAPNLWTYQLHSPPPPPFTACTEAKLETSVQCSFSNKNIKKCNPAMIRNYYWFLQSKTDAVKKEIPKATGNMHKTSKVVRTMSRFPNQWPI